MKVKWVKGVTLPCQFHLFIYLNPTLFPTLPTSISNINSPLRIQRRSQCPRQNCTRRPHSMHLFHRFSFDICALAERLLARCCCWLCCCYWTCWSPKPSIDCWWWWHWVMSFAVAAFPSMLEIILSVSRAGACLKSSDQAEKFRLGSQTTTDFYKEVAQRQVVPVVIALKADEVLEDLWGRERD